MKPSANNLRRPRIVRQGISWLPQPSTLYGQHPKINVIRMGGGSQDLDVEFSGLRHVVNKSLSLRSRLLWLTVFLGALLTCFCQSAVIILKVFEDSSVTNVQYVHKKSIEMPAITICPFNREAKYPVLNPSLIKQKYGNISEDGVLNKLNGGTITLPELWSMYTLNISDISITTSDHSEEVVTNINNIKSAMISEVHTVAGTCVQIQLKNRLKLYERSIFFNVKLAGDFCFALAAVHPPEDFPIEKYLYRRNGKVVTCGNLEKQFLRITQFKNRNSTKHLCATGPTVSSCLAQCFVDKFLRKETGQLCRLPFINTEDAIPLCSNRSNIENMISAIYNATEQYSPELCDCPKKCLETLFGVEYQHRRSFGTNVKLTWRIEIHIPDVRINVMEEASAYNEYSVFSDLGGVIGLWLGICFLGMIEFFTSLVANLWRKLKNKKLMPLNTTGRKLRIFVVRHLPVNKPHPASDYPGINRIFKENSSLWVRVLWLILFTVVSVICVYQCIQQTLYYFSDPSSTNIFYSINDTISLPSIIACHKRQDGLLPAVNPIFIQKFFGSFDPHIHAAQLIKNGTMTIDDIWNVSSLDIAASAFESLKIDWNYHVMNTIVGNCYTFNPKHQVKYTGSQTSQTVQFWGDFSQTKLIIVRTKEEEPLVKYFAQSYAVESRGDGWQGTYVFRITQLSYRNTQDSPCQDQRKVISCLAKCVTKSITKISQGYCRLPYMEDFYSTTPICTTEKDFNRILNATLHVISEFQRDTCLCSKICQQLVYTTEFANEDTVSSPGLITVVLQSRDNRVMVVEEIPAYNGFALFADIGGALGLFTGMCVIHMFEIAGAICSVMKSYFKIMICCKRADLTCKSQTHSVRTVVIKEIRPTDPTSASESNILKSIQTTNNSSPMWVRCLWFIISVGAFILCCYQSKERIQHFLTDPTETSTYYSYNKTIMLPLILICPVVRNSIYSFPWQEIQFLKYWDVSTLQAELEISLNEMHFTTYNGTKGGTIDVTKKITSAGICFAAKVDMPLQYKGYHTSVHILLFSDRIRGVWITYLTADDQALTNYMSPGYSFVPTGTKQAELSLYITEVFHRNTRQNPCDHGETSAVCVTNCIERKIYSKLKIKCRLPFMKESGTYPICRTWDEYLGIRNASVEVLESFDKSGCNCPRNCKEVMYNLEDAMIGSTPSNAIKLKTSFPENRIAIIQEEASYGFVKLLSDLGGSLGLFFGIGLLQMLELLTENISKLSIPVLR